jgi:Predicted unsaturated glucuronyl hydrolase involved in regulation of bacterial surface properties, and related proteins
LHANTGEQRYRHCTDALASFLAGHVRSASGLIPYRKTLSSLLLVDTVGMICPFLARYGAAEGKVEAINDAVAHAVDIIDNAIDCHSGLPFHGHVDRGAPVGIAGWARGTGWFLLGLTGILDYLPSDHEAGEKLKDHIRQTAEKLRAFQRSDGCWGWAITNPFSTPETSGTALIAFSLLKTRLLGIIGEKYDGIIHDAYRGICNAMTAKGYVLGASGDCIYGPGVYPTKFSHQMWAQGAASAFLALYAHWHRSRYAADADFERNESISTNEGKK